MTKPKPTVKTFNDAGRCTVKLGQSFRCPECAKEHETNDTYLAAHWDEELTKDCSCGIVFAIRSGRIRILQPPA